MYSWTDLHLKIRQTICLETNHQPVPFTDLEVPIITYCSVRLYTDFVSRPWGLMVDACKHLVNIRVPLNTENFEFDIQKTVHRDMFL